MTKKIRCIDNTNYETCITKGKIYEVNDSNDIFHYSIDTDNEYATPFFAKQGLKK